MSIQHIAGGNSSNGIMSFLFNDDGSGTEDGLVLEGADFSSALHMLLGEYEAEGALPQAGSETSATASASETTLPANLLQTAGIPAATTPAVSVSGHPLSAELDALAGDFALPQHNTTEADDVAWLNDAEGPEIKEVFGRGIDHLIGLVREAAHVTPHAGGKLQPASGKSLPQDLRSSEPATLQSGDVLAAILPFTPPQDLKPTPVQAPARDRTASRVLNMQASRRSLQGLRNSITAPQRAASNDADTRLPVASATAFTLPETALLAAANAAEAQGTAMTAASNGTQTHGMHNQNGAAPLHALAAKTAAPENTGTTFANPQLYSPHTMGSDAWMQDLGTRVEWLRDLNVSTAELQLHPAELGSLEIRIQTENDSTTVSFITDNPGARDIIEHSLPQLRELLASQGMQLGQSHVSHQSAEGQRRGHETAFSQTPAQPDNTKPEDAQPLRHTGYIADPSRIDHYV